MHFGDATPVSQKGIWQWGSALNDSTPFILIERDTSGNARFYVDGNYKLDYAISNSVWTHITVVLNTSDLWTFYVDGVARGTYQDDATHTNQGDSIIYLGNGYNGYFDGSIDDTRIYTRALSTSEVVS